MLVDMYIKGLPCNEMKRHVYLAKAGTLAEAINAAVSYEAFDGGPSLRKPKPTVAAIGTDQNTKLSEVIDKLADRVEVLQSDLSKMKGKSGPPAGRYHSTRGPGVVCYRCQELGHFSRECPLNNPSNGASPNAPPLPNSPPKN
jgi:hypothetical protein